MMSNDMFVSVFIVLLTILFVTLFSVGVINFSCLHTALTLSAPCFQALPTNFTHTNILHEN